MIFAPRSWFSSPKSRTLQDQLVPHISYYIALQAYQNVRHDTAVPVHPVVYLQSQHPLHGWKHDGKDPLAGARYQSISLGFRPFYALTVGLDRRLVPLVMSSAQRDYWESSWQYDPPARTTFATPAPHHVQLHVPATFQRL